MRVTPQWHVCKKHVFYSGLRLSSVRSRQLLLFPRFPQYNDVTVSSAVYVCRRWWWIEWLKLSPPGRSIKNVITKFNDYWMMGSPKNCFCIYCSAPGLSSHWQQNRKDYFHMQSTASSQHKHVSTIYRQSQVIHRDILEPKLFCSTRAGVATSIETCTGSNIVKLLNTYCVYVENTYVH